MARPLIVAIDGPSGAGKSTVAKALAARLGFTLVDTGAIYRCVALKARRQALGLDDDAGLAALVEGLEVSFQLSGDGNRVLLDREDVSEAIRTPENSLAASQVAARAVVRSRLLELQRRLARAAERGAVLEGRDIGTVVFPDADVKVFLHADPAVRASRRHDELSQKGLGSSVAQVLAEQTRRDRDDSEREVAPLKPAPDAVSIDSSELDAVAVVEQIESLVHARGR
jgi:cytidylate kinase